MKYILPTAIVFGALCLTSLAADDNNNTAVDNTGINSRDRSAEAKTAGDQSNSPEDIRITAAIRRAIVKDDSLSMTAKNIKIITADAQVTLRGPVDTQEEKAEIEKIAKSAGGSAKIDNQLEVKQSQ